MAISEVGQHRSVETAHGVEELPFGTIGGRILSDPENQKFAWQSKQFVEIAQLQGGADLVLAQRREPKTAVSSEDAMFQDMRKKNER